MSTIDCKVREILESLEGGGMNEDGTGWKPKPWSEEDKQIIMLT